MDGSWRYPALRDYVRPSRRPTSYAPARIATLALWLATPVSNQLELVSIRKLGYARLFRRIVQPQTILLGLPALYVTPFRESEFRVRST
jgi:hypothetical protein